MKGLYIYAIADRPVRARGRGVFGRRLRTVAAAGLYVVVETARVAPKPTLARLRAQNRAVAALVAAGASVLPARFGAYVASRERLEEALRARGAALRRALREVRGCVQMTLRVPLVSESRGAPSLRQAGSRRSGAAFLRARARAARAPRRDPLVRAITRTARPFARASSIDRRDDVDLAIIHHLVPRPSVEQYAHALTGLAAGQPRTFTVSGPWAPFAFVEIS